MQSGVHLRGAFEDTDLASNLEHLDELIFLIDACYVYPYIIEFTAHRVDDTLKVFYGKGALLHRWNIP